MHGDEYFDLLKLAVADRSLFVPEADLFRFGLLRGLCAGVHSRHEQSNQGDEQFATQIGRGKREHVFLLMQLAAWRG